MCTLLTLSSAKWGRAAEKRIREDASANPHGMSLLLIKEDGSASQLRTFDVQLVLTVLRNSDWARFFLHSRWSTQGEVNLQNTHGWEEDGVFYMHNGCLSHPDAGRHAVDSQLIGEWLRAGDRRHALASLEGEGFANVLLVTPEIGEYIVSRSVGGSLHTDGEGNFSTSDDAELGLVQDVTPGYTVHDMPRPRPRPSWGWRDDADYSAWEDKYFLDRAAARVPPADDSIDTRPTAEDFDLLEKYPEDWDEYQEALDTRDASWLREIRQMWAELESEAGPKSKTGTGG